MTADTQNSNAERAGEKTEKLRPTLFIAVGGTGMEVSLRFRRKILNALWGKGTPQRVSSLLEFPLAQFIHFDLDSGSVTEQGKSAKTDLLSEQVKFTDEERMIEKLELSKYIRSERDLSVYPHIQKWFPLTPQKIKDLKIDPTKGAGQIRALSRLYFFDKYRQIREKITFKINRLRSNMTNKEMLDRLGVATDTEKGVRVVVIGSTAGGTGSGCFLDMGFLSKLITHEIAPSSTVDLVMLLPSGYVGNNASRVQANTYAALMELEACMREGIQFVEKWDPNEDPTLDSKPYDDVFLLDTSNLANNTTQDVTDIYEMAADALFQDFASADFANKKRSVAVNQQQHKVSPYEFPLPIEFGEGTKLNYSKNYSTFGQAKIDTQQEVKKNIQNFRHVNAMLRSFFGVAQQKDAISNIATNVHRDDFLKTHLDLKRYNFTDLPQFGSDANIRLTMGEFWDYSLSDEMLKGILPEIEADVARTFDEIEQGSSIDTWVTRVNESLLQLERNNIAKAGGAATNNETRVELERRKLYAKFISPEVMPKAFYELLDDKRFGGLDYVLSLVELIKDRIDNDVTGLVKELELNSKRFRELSDNLKTREFARDIEHLNQCKGMFGWKEDQARIILSALRKVIMGYLQMHLRAVAAHQAAEMVKDISAWMGSKSGTDENGDPVWTGFVNELQEGRNNVVAMIKSLDADVAQMQQSAKEPHRLVRSITTDLKIDDEVIASADEFRNWADEAFAAFGKSREIFAMLKSDEGRAELLSKLRNKAASLTQLNNASDINPLIVALRKKSVTERQQLFTELLSNAMPWMAINLNGKFRVDADQFKGYIGVAGSREFESEFGAELKNLVPSQSKMTGQQLGIVDSGVPGQLVCYVELSGVALPGISSLETWHARYKEETQRIPCHTHRDTTLFVHPTEPTVVQLARRAEDFKAFIKGIVFGILERDGSGYDAPYKIDLGDGEWVSVGSERTVRMGDLHADYRKMLDKQCEKKFSQMTNACQYALLAQLLKFSSSKNYPRRLIQLENKTGLFIKGLPHHLVAQLQVEMMKKLKEKINLDPNLNEGSLLERADSLINRFSVAIDGSETDIYVSEVGSEVMPKRKLISEFFDARKVEEAFGGDAAKPINTPLGSMQMPGASTSAQFWVVVNGVVTGPHTVDALRSMIPTGELSNSSQVCPVGSQNWVLVSQVPELAMLFNLAPPAPPPPPPPPPAPGSQ
jgi:hypothetical protein